ncbi:hypothetical protein BHM03_00014385 [Ensete ventricosum]|nr:hypothetical protein BHM03_00014385 [Ensete ventricosum]
MAPNHDPTQTSDRRTAAPAGEASKNPAASRFGRSLSARLLFFDPSDGGRSVSFGGSMSPLLGRFRFGSLYRFSVIQREKVGMASTERPRGEHTRVVTGPRLISNAWWKCVPMSSLPWPCKLGGHDA